MCGEVMTGTHVVEECPEELDQWHPQRAEWKEWKEALGGRAKKRKEEGEEEVDLLEMLFYHVYEFLYSFSVPVHLPPVIVVSSRYAINLSDRPLLFLIQLVLSSFLFLLLLLFTP